MTESKEDEEIKIDPKDSAAKETQSGPADGDSQEEMSATEEMNDKIEELQSEVSQLAEEKQQVSDQLLRKSAEFENFRRRLLKDKEDSIRYANTQLLSDLIEIIDNFERAIASGRDSQDFESFFSGVEMIENQLVSTLDNKYGLKRFESKGEEFDPQKHEAVAMLPAEEGEERQLVMEELQKGYTLGDRVLRHSKVAVSKPAE